MITIGAVILAIGLICAFLYIIRIINRISHKDQNFIPDPVKIYHNHPFVSQRMVVCLDSIEIFIDGYHRDNK